MQFNKANLSKPLFQDSLALREIWEQLQWLSQTINFNIYSSDTDSKYDKGALNI